MTFFNPLKCVSTQWMTHFVLISLFALSASAGQSDPKKCPPNSLKRVIQKCAQLGVLISCSRLPSAEAGWVAGTTLDCATFDAVSAQGATSVTCLQYGPTDHGVTCQQTALGVSGPFSGVICSLVYTPDEDALRYCGQTNFDTIGPDAGVVCDQYGDDRYAPYCTATDIANARGYENVMCSQVYCPTCVRYIPTPSSGSCFPEKTWLKVRLSDGTIQAKPMRDVRLGDQVQVSQDADGNEVYSNIVDIPHRQPGKKGSFLKVVHHGASFLISPEHLVYVAQSADEEFNQKTARTKFAKDLVSGDFLWTQNSTLVALESNPEPVMERGMYAPESEAGTLVVYGNPEVNQGTLVSCYSTFKDPVTTQAFFKMRRAAFPPEPIEADTVRRSGPWDDAWLSTAQALYPSGFMNQPKAEKSENEKINSQPRTLRGHRDEL